MANCWVQGKHPLACGRKRERDEGWGWGRGKQQQGSSVSIQEKTSWQEVTRLISQSVQVSAGGISENSTTLSTTAQTVLPKRWPPRCWP